MELIVETSRFLLSNDDYGQCLTDIPSKKTGEAYVRYCRHDFVYGGAYHRMAMDLLSDFEMELPHRDNIYRGRHDDILFLDRYGLTVRVGDIDVADFINPAILQPLSWVSKNGLVMAVYPGIRHQNFNPGEFQDYEEFCCSNSQSTSSVVSFLIDSFQKANDVRNVNVGSVTGRINNIVGDVPMVFDVNRDDNHTLDADVKAKKHAINGVDMVDRPAAVIKIMDSLYSGVQNCEAFMAGQKTFHPLRQELSDCLSVKGVWERRDRLKQFFEHCERLTKKPVSELSLHSDWSRKPAMG